MKKEIKVGGKVYRSYKDIHDYQDACRVLGISADDFAGDLSLRGMSKREVAFRQLCVIAIALNRWERPVLYGKSEKYYPVFCYKWDSKSTEVPEKRKAVDVYLLRSQLTTSSKMVNYPDFACSSDEICVYFAEEFHELWKDFYMDCVYV